jgi:hypothetical protein
VPSTRVALPAGRRLGGDGGLGDDGAALVCEEDTQEAFALLVGALGDFGLPKKTESGERAPPRVSDKPVELGRYVYSTEEATAVSLAANHLGKEVKAPRIKSKGLVKTSWSMVAVDSRVLAGRGPTCSR